VRQYLDSASAPAAFPSQRELIADAAAVLESSLAITTAAALQLASQAVAELRETGDLRLVKETGSVCFQRSDRSARVVFQHAGGCDPPEEPEESSSAPWDEARSNLLLLLEATPLGVSCADFTMWRESGFADVDFVQAGRCPTVLDFVVAEEAELGGRRPGCAFFHPPGSADCFPVPIARDSGARETAATQFVAALKARDAAAAAAWCLSAQLGLVDGPFLTALLNSFTLQCFESYGVDAVPRLCEELLQVAFALPVGTGTRHHAQILAMVLESLAFASKLSFESAQRCALDWAQNGKDRTVVRRLLAASKPSAASSLVPLLHQAAATLVGASAKLLLPAHRTAEACASGGIAGAQRSSSTALAPQSLSYDSTGARGAELPPDSTEPMTSQAEVLPQDGRRTSDQEAAVLRLLEKDFHYTEGGRCRPSGESPEGRKLQQALQLLSANLYSSQAHFVMELVQNADDNDYHASVTPTLRVQLFPHAVVVFNNEVGFSERNIVAVCNVNGSTKLHKSGYIGQKGIG
jgi:hypothetical protein